MGMKFVYLCSYLATIYCILATCDIKMSIVDDRIRYFVLMQMAWKSIVHRHPVICSMLDAKCMTGVLNALSVHAHFGNFK